jgi:hypothetical protein
MKYILVLLIMMLNWLAHVEAKESRQRISLAGEWRFAADPKDKGKGEQWYKYPLADRIFLPGSMATNGKGDDVTLNTRWIGQIVDSSFFKNKEFGKYRVSGNIKIPFWLQPVKHYQGAAWYQRDVVIPKNWKGKAIELFLERCHWESQVWVDGKAVGLQNSLGTPHTYNLTALLTPGIHSISVCIDNRVKDFDPGENSHSISDHTQTNWNGIVGQIHLEAKPLVTIKNIQVFANIKQKKLTAKVKVENITGKEVRGELVLLVTGQGENIKKSVQYNLARGADTLAIELAMGDNVKLWSEFHPDLYNLAAELRVPSMRIDDTLATTFGMRAISVEGTQLLINGKPLFLRGTLECAIFPKTGYPPTNIEEWLRIFRICRAHGLNHMRFHSWCPPKAAFDAADKLGFYLHVECSSWANQSTTLGDGKPFDKYLYEESERMIEAYGNHPSFCIMLYGNEPGGNNQGAFLTNFVSYWKTKDNRRIYSSGAGWPNLKVNDFLSSAAPRIQGWGEGLSSIINSQPPRSDYDWMSKIKKFNQPVVSHEIGQWCVYPNLKEIAKYTGVVRAKNFEIFQEKLKENGMTNLADSFLLASGKLQALCYKADIEAALRTPSFGGFQLLDLHDFPGQGTALVGVLDSFWDEKGYITPKEYSRFCNSTVPLARLKKHIYTNADTLTASVEVAHFGDEALKSCTPIWKISDTSGNVVFSGALSTMHIPLGNCISLGHISVSLASVQKAQKLELEVAVGNYSNSWDIWVYPSTKEVLVGADSIRMVSELDAATQQYLENGGSVLLSLKKGMLKPEFGGKIEIGFSSIFWNTAWTNGQAPHTLGILCNPQHPSLANFPTEYHTNWQWWDAMSHSSAIMFAPISSEIKPIVRVIDDWFTNRPLALLFEVKVGKGKLLVSGIDFNQEMDKRPEAQQLLFSLKKYMLSNHFNPNVRVEAGVIKSIVNNSF